MLFRIHFCLALLAGFSVRAADDYKLGPDSMVQPGVPQGVITKFTNWHSKIFTNTVRDWWIYVPAQYDAAKPASSARQSWIRKSMRPA